MKKILLSISLVIIGIIFSLIYYQNKFHNESYNNNIFNANYYNNYGQIDSLKDAVWSRFYINPNHDESIRKDVLIFYSDTLLIHNSLTTKLDYQFIISHLFNCENYSSFSIEMYKVEDDSIKLIRENKLLPGIHFKILNDKLFIETRNW